MADPITIGSLSLTGLKFLGGVAASDITGRIISPMIARMFDKVNKLATAQDKNRDLSVEFEKQSHALASSLGIAVYGDDRYNQMQRNIAYLSDATGMNVLDVGDLATQLIASGKFDLSKDLDTLFEQVNQEVAKIADFAKAGNFNLDEAVHKIEDLQAVWQGKIPEASEMNAIFASVNSMTNLSYNDIVTAFMTAGVNGNLAQSNWVDIGATIINQVNNGLRGDSLNAKLSQLDSRELSKLPSNHHDALAIFTQNQFLYLGTQLANQLNQVNSQGLIGKSTSLTNMNNNNSSVSHLTNPDGENSVMAIIEKQLVELKQPIADYNQSIVGIDRNILLNTYNAPINELERIQLAQKVAERQEKNALANNNSMAALNLQAITAGLTTINTQYFNENELGSKVDGIAIKEGWSQAQRAYSLRVSGIKPALLNHYGSFTSDNLLTGAIAQTSQPLSQISLMRGFSTQETQSPMQRLQLWRQPLDPSIALSSLMQSSEESMAPLFTQKEEVNASFVPPEDSLAVRVTEIEVQQQEVSTHLASEIARELSHELTPIRNSLAWIKQHLRKQEPLTCNMDTGSS